MEIFIWIVVGLMLCLGFLGCFINKIPGPIFLLIGVVVAQFGLDIPGWGPVAIVGVIAVAAFILSKVMTRVGKKLQEYSKGASLATTIASLIALGLVVACQEASSVVVILVFLLGFVVLPFLFAFAVESIRQKNATAGAKSALAATIVYLCDTALKLAAFAYAIYAMFMQ
ncbi:MAG: DUF456 family protein [Bacteroidales bacterium]|nr:DUF456 family protein [Bacteroidales bacterium]